MQEYLDIIERPQLIIGALAFVAVVFIGVTVLFLRRPAGLRKVLIASVPLAVVVVGMAIYALASPVYVAQHPVLELDGLYRLLAPLPSIFRSSGRFIWPMYYLLVLAVLACLARSLSRRRIGIAMRSAGAPRRPLVDTRAAPGRLSKRRRRPSPRRGRAYRMGWRSVTDPWRAPERPATGGMQKTSAPKFSKTSRKSRHCRAAKSRLHRLRRFIHGLISYSIP